MKSDVWSLRLQTVLDGAKRRKEVRKLYRHLLQCEASIREETRKLGETCLDADLTDSDTVRMQREVVSSLREASDEWQRQIDAAEGVARCPHCGCVADREDRYCRRCAHPFQSSPAAPVQVVWPQEPKDENS